jgi:heme/copper-type cytochrome/quinol oxidase subunit 3
MSQTIAFPRLPVGSVGRHANGWWGMMTLILTEAALFGYLLFSYYYLAVQHGRDWLPERLPNFALSAPNSILLIASSFVAAYGERQVLRGGSRAKAAASLALAAFMGGVFFGVQMLEWTNKDFTLASNSYGSLYYAITGFHAAHVIVGVLVLIVLALWTGLGYFDTGRSAPVSVGVIYWHFVDAVWVVVFFTFYVTPRLGVG